jgi:NitT/TauT family transport system substrate-binding protein
MSKHSPTILLRRRGFLGQAAALALLSQLPVVAGCAPAAPPSSLKLGLLPIIDSLPLYVAEQDGLWKDQGVTVELSLFASALERDAALQAGQIDLVLNDLVSASLLASSAGTAGYQVVRLSYRGTPSMAMMTVLSAPGSAITQPAQLKGVEIAVSGNTVIEYATDRMLELAGLASADIRKSEVTKIPVRLELLAKAQVRAATLPEPFASLGESMGATRVIDDAKTGIGTSVITARKALIDGSADALRGFLGAYEAAVKSVTASPEKYRALFVDKAKVPQAVEKTLPIPSFPEFQLPTPADVAGVSAWMVGKGLVQQPISYDGLVAKGISPRSAR